MIFPLNIDADMMEQLDTEANLRGVSKAEIVRRAVTDYLADERPRADKTTLAQLRKNLRDLQKLHD